MITTTRNRLLGVRVGARSLQELVMAGNAAITQGGSFVFACANPHSLVVARRDADFRAALNAADAVVADGVGCTLAARLTGASVGPRVTRTDFFVSTMTALNHNGGRAYFFGSRDFVLARLETRVNVNFPNVTTKTFSPPY